MKIHGEFEIETGEILASFIRFMEEKGIRFSLVDENYYKANLDSLCKSQKKTIEVVLSELGIRLNTTGGIVLRQIVPNYKNDKKLKELYCEYAIKTGMSDTQIEKGIFNARRTAKRSNPELYDKLFSKSNSISYFLGVLKSITKE